jgi:hypothetical protein
MKMRFLRALVGLAIGFAVDKKDRKLPGPACRASVWWTDLGPPFTKALCGWALKTEVHSSKETSMTDKQSYSLLAAIRDHIVKHDTSV